MKLLNSLAVLLGRDPRKPDASELSEDAKNMHEAHAGRRSREEALHIKAERDKKRLQPRKWRRRRWTVLILVNSFFALSYFLDIQALEGALTGSRFVGFHLADVNSTLQIMLAFKHVLINLLIGTTTIAMLWWLLGGRTFCSWVCPYHLLSELAEMLHMKLLRKKLIKSHSFDRGTRSILWLSFALMAVLTGYTVFESISPTGILSRAIVYGPGLAMIWVLFLLAFEVFYSRRAWCRYMCPIGLTYGVIGATSPMKVTYHLADCFHDGECRKVCLVPHVLDATKRNFADELTVDLGADCTRCGACIDACPTNSLRYNFKGLGDLL